MIQARLSSISSLEKKAWTDSFEYQVTWSSGNSSFPVTYSCCLKPEGTRSKLGCCLDVNFSQVYRFACCSTHVKSCEQRTWVKSFVSVPLWLDPVAVEEGRSRLYQEQQHKLQWYLLGPCQVTLGDEFFFFLLQAIWEKRGLAIPEELWRRGKPYSNYLCGD